MKKFLSLVFFTLIGLFGGRLFGQTTASYSFTALTGTYASISSTGTAVTTISGDDLTQTGIAIGFTFNFCGVNYTTLSACSNGWVSLANSGVATFGNVSGAIPGAGFLMPFWDDLHGAGHTAYYQTSGTAPNRVFTFEWNNFHTFSASGNANFQVKLFETSNIIEFHYGSSTYSGLSASIGIANSTTDWQSLPSSGASPTPSGTTFTSSISTSPASGQIYRWAPCPVTVSATNSSPVCPGSSVTLTGTSSGTSFVWSGPGGYTSTSLVSTISSIPSTGAGTYTLVASNGTCTMVATTVVTLNPSPPSFTITPPTATSCGSAVMLTVPPITASDVTSTFNSTSAFSVPDASAAGATNDISVTGIPASATILDVAVKLNSVSMTFVGDLSFNIQAPNTNNLNLIDRRGGGGDNFTNTNVWSASTTSFATGTPPFTGTFAADATPAIGPTGFVSNVTTWPALYSTINGNWKLCVRDWAGADLATVNSWSVIIHYSTPSGSYTWSPTTGLYLDAALTVPYTGTPTNTVYASPAATTTYTATGTITGFTCATTASATITYSPAAGAISGPTNVCAGSTITLTNATGGGTWSSSNPGIASIISTTGVVTGVSAGTATISYTTSSGCFTIYNITVNVTPSTITGTGTVCVGSNTTLSSTPAGGAWSSSNAAVGTVGAATGIVTGISAGTTTITYNVGGCVRTTIVTVNPLPAPIVGTTFSLCTGQTITLTNPTPGGIWQTSTPGVASVGITTGIVTGVSAGTATISYRVSGCSATAVVTVVGAPAVAGASVCVGLTTTLAGTPAGGTWVSGTPANATIGGTSGVVTGVNPGTSTITYSIGTGCVANAVVTVLPLPAAIGGTLSVCPGLTTTATNATAGGTWSASAGTGSVTIGSTTGVITGGTAGTATITYTITSSGCYRTATVTVNPVPSPIIGAYTACAGATTTFSNTTGGGTWSSSNPGVLSIGASTGIATAGASSGTATISYILTATGCYTTATITVNPLPSAIGGTFMVCPGLTTTLTDATPGGTWSISPVTTATIDAATGVVTGVAAGTATVTYTAGTGCYRTATVTVNTPPAAIGGSAGVCVGFTTTLTNTTPGGTWSSGTPAVATVGASTGVVTGGSAGTATITYTVTATGCFSTIVVTVNAGPGTILGTPSVCVGQTTSLSSSSPGGTWSSSNPAVATVDAATGVVTGVMAGTTTITTALGSGCNTTVVVTVTPLPSPIAGTMSVCAGQCNTLTDASAGGTWSISPTSVATIVSGTGVYCGVAAGTATVTYTTGCPTTTVITVNPIPAAITGTLSLCPGTTTTLSTTTAAVSWSSSNATVATIDATGLVTGVSAGTVTITCFTLPTGCFRTATVTVNALPAVIGGTASVCVGSTTVLTNATGGGTWSSSTPAVATISATGVVSGVAAGTSTITYTVTATGCIRTTVVTVNPLPSAITGTLTLCPGTTTTLSSASAGGVWSSGNLAVASVNSTTGVVTGNSTGVATITYTLSGTGCRTTAVVTVNPLPGAITGTATVCQTQCTTLSSATAGGTWSTTAGTGSVSVTAAGVVCGATAGTAIVTYTLSSTGCYQTRIVTVVPDPAAIGGVLSVCAGSTTTLNNTTGGGSWISGSTSIASVNPSTGVVTGVSSGTSVITYILSSGCYSTAVVTVTTAPTAITGTMTVCEGSVTTLSSTPTGGTWSSSDITVATVDAAGDVTGGTAGTATITYSLGTGCTKTTTVTVNISPAPITGPSATCIGSAITLSDATPGGSWSSSNAAVATVSATGVVTGISGTATVTITYSMPAGCARYHEVTVNALPGAIAGTLTVCEGQTSALSSATAGGTWSSADAAIATVNTTTGVVTGGDDGTTTITYSLGTGCITTAVVTVLPLPDAIGGTLAVCSGLTTTLTDATAGGSWSSSNPAIAAIGATTGVVTAGTVAVATTATITYTLASTGCYITAEVTVNPLPAPIMGASGFCNLTTTTLTDATAGGTWSSADPSVAYFTDPTIGALTGATVGTVIVTYTLPTGCIDTAVRTTILAPYPITGSAEVCEGSCTTLGNTITGGTWTSDNSLIAPISTPGGVVCGVSTGTTNITYELSNGCYSSWTQTVNPTPGAITGMHEVCIGLTTTLYNTLPGGGWTSSNAAVAEIEPATGVVSGIAAGTATITYMMATGCLATSVVTVNPLPDALTGTMEVCVGLTTTLTSTTPGGTWSSSNTGIADVSGGVVVGNSSGEATITYTLPTGCIAPAVVTVNPLPSPITGTFVICEDNSTVLDNITPGGTWSSSDASIASISPAGVVFGDSAGEVTITYTLPTGCISTQSFTVNPIPSGIGGSLLVCTGFMSNLTNTIAGGVWSMSGFTSVATIHPLTGVVTGITPGTITVTYTLGTGCLATAVVTVSPLPPAITGTAQVCEASTTTLADAAPGGTWTSSDATIASVDALLGVVSGHTSGTATITYTIATGCINIRHVTVNPLPNAITGDTAVCEHFTTTLSNTTPGGAWNSSNTVVAGIGLTSGVVTGLSAGTTNISYTVVATGCLRSRVVTVHPTPQPIAGSPYICIGSSRTFSNLMTGGSWLSSNTAVATIGSASGIASGITLGTSVITYRMPVTGCYVTKTATVSPLPNVYTVTGGGNYCSGGTGVPVGLSGSQGGVSYLLSYGASATGYMTGTGAAISFGPMTVAGTYTVLATDAVSGCTRNMVGSATVTILPLVTPVVTINTGEGDSLCAGGPHLFRADTVHAGAAPTYTWRVNGVAVGVGQTYSFIPADGDVVRVTMNSTGLCASPTAVTDTMRVTILPQEMPMAFISADPGDTVCQFSLTTYSATATGGGTAPLYTWLVNGAAMGTGPSFSYVPEHNDVVNVLLESSYKCALEDSVYSGNVVMAVDSMIVPHITIEATPGLLVTEGQMVTLNTTVTHAGVSPTYQWKVNGIPVPGATNPTYTSTFNHYDSVTCMVTSDGWCKDITTFDWVFISVGPLGVSHANLGTDLMLLPNPNKGEFTIRGMLPAGNDQELTAEVTDMLGQVVYRGRFTSRNGRVEEKIQLTGTLANGMYMLNLRSQTDSKVFHFVMEQ